MQRMKVWSLVRELRFLHHAEQLSLHTTDTEPECSWAQVPQLGSPCATTKGSLMPLTNKICCLVTKLCLTLCGPMDCSPPGSFVYGIFQARILEWVAISSSKGSSWPRDLFLHFLHCQADSLPWSHLGSLPAVPECSLFSASSPSCCLLSFWW